MNVHQTDCDIHFMTYVSQITVLYTLNSAVCPLCVNKTGRKKPQKRFKKKWTSFCILLYKRQFSTSSALACLPILQTDKWKSDVVRWFDQALSLHLTTGPCLELPSTGPRSLRPICKSQCLTEWRMTASYRWCHLPALFWFIPAAVTHPPFAGLFSSSIQSTAGRSPFSCRKHFSHPRHCSFTGQPRGPGPAGQAFPITGCWARCLRAWGAVCSDAYLFASGSLENKATSSLCRQCG